MTMNKFVVAVSGGVDSVVLAHRFGEQGRLAAIVHINHHTRGNENQKEIKIVKDIADKYNVVCYVFDYFHIEGNFQAKAREFRYNCLLDIANKYCCPISTAHHLDDQLENAAMATHLIRSGLMSVISSYKGIKIYRPLLGMRKKQLYKIASENKFQFNEDYSNKDTKYNRNQKRHLIATDSQFHYQAMCKYIVEVNKQQLAIKVKEEFINLEQFKNKTDYYKLTYMYYFLKSLNCVGDVSNNLLTDLLELINSGKKASYSIANSNQLLIGYDKIYMLTNEDKTTANVVATLGINTYNGITFNLERNDLYIRTYYVGEKVAIHNGHKKISRLFIDNKIDRQLRRYWPIVVDENDQVIYIPKIWRKDEIN